MLPDRDADGRRVIFNTAKALNPSRHTRQAGTAKLVFSGQSPFQNILDDTKPNRPS